MQKETFAVVAEYGNLAEAEVAKSYLESAGIWATIRNEFMTSLASGALPLQLVVREGDAPAVREMLKRR